MWSKFAGFDLRFEQINEDFGGISITAGTPCRPTFFCLFYDARVIAMFFFQLILSFSGWFILFYPSQDHSVRRTQCKKEAERHSSVNGDIGFARDNCKCFVVIDARPQYFQSLTSPVPNTYRKFLNMHLQHSFSFGDYYTSSVVARLVFRIL